MLNVFCTLKLVLSAVCAVPNRWVFITTLASYFPGTLVSYCLNDFEIVPGAHVITGITFAFTFHMRQISVEIFIFRIFSTFFLIILQSPEIATHINIRVPLSLS